MYYSTRVKVRYSCGLLLENPFEGWCAMNRINGRRPIPRIFRISYRIPQDLATMIEIFRAHCEPLQRWGLHESELTWAVQRQLGIYDGDPVGDRVWKQRYGNHGIEAQFLMSAGTEISLTLAAPTVEELGFTSETCDLTELRIGEVLQRGFDLGFTECPLQTVPLMMLTDMCPVGGQWVSVVTKPLQPSQHCFRFYSLRDQYYPFVIHDAYANPEVRVIESDPDGGGIAFGNISASGERGPLQFTGSNRLPRYMFAVPDPTPMQPSSAELPTVIELNAIDARALAQHLLPHQSVTVIELPQRSDVPQKLSA